VDVAVAVVAVAAAVAVAVAALPGELAAGARPARGVIASINLSCHGRVRASRPGQLLSFSLVATDPAGSPVDAGATRTVFQVMFSHDFSERFSGIGTSDPLRPLTASRLPQALPW